MKSLFKKLPGSKIELEVTLESKEFHAYWQKAFDEVLGGVNLKGFRPGNAPRELAEKAVDQEKVFDRAAKDAVRFSLDEISGDHEWTIIDSPKIEILEASPSGETGLRYRANLVLFPEIQLSDYKKIARNVFSEKKDITINDEEIIKALEWLRSSRAKLTRAEHPVRAGDLVNADIESRIEGKEPTAAKGDEFVVGQSHWFPGFDKELEGHSSGETFSFKLEAPKGGKHVEFTVTVNSVFDRVLPELDDIFAQGLGTDFKTIDDLKKNIREGLLHEKNEKEKERKRIKALDEIRASAKMDAPQIMVEKQLDYLVQEFKSYAPGSGKSDDELRPAFRDRAKENVERNLVIYKIVKTEHLEPLPEEVAGEIQRQNLDQEKYYDYIYNILQNKKLFEFLEK